MTEALCMARLLLVLVAALWLFAGLHVVRARLRSRGDRRLLVALATLSAWQVSPMTATSSQLVVPLQRSKPDGEAAIPARL
jgi:hypothetical protein